MILLSYDVNDHAFLKSKFIELCSDLANIEVTRILTLSWTDKYVIYVYWLKLLNNYEIKSIVIYRKHSNSRHNWVKSYQIFDNFSETVKIFALCSENCSHFLH